MDHISSHQSTLGLPEDGTPSILGSHGVITDGGPIMAKKRTQPVPKAKPEGPLPNVISMRGTLEWRGWLRELAEHCRATPSGLIDRALAELARREGFKGPPPRL